MNKIQLREALLEGASLLVIQPIDDVYRDLVQIYLSVQGGYKRLYIGASNRPYCPTCGTAYGQHGPSCSCDQIDQIGTMMEIHDAYRELVSLERQGFAIEIME